MTSPQKIESNRRNALKSTGPRTGKSKDIVAANATKHGLLARHAVIEGESQVEYDAFRAATFDDRAPVGMMEHELTDIIASSFWRLRRIKRIEVELLDSFTDTPSPSPGKENKLPFTFILTKTYTGLPPEDDDSESPTENTHADVEAKRKSACGGPTTDNSPNCHPERSNAESRDLSNPQSPTTQPRRSAGEVVSGASAKQSEVSAEPNQIKEPETSSLGELSASPRISLGHAFVTDTAAGNALTKLQRYEAHIYRTLYKAIDELRRFQRERRSQIDLDNIVDMR